MERRAAILPTENEPKALSRSTKVVAYHEELEHLVIAHGGRAQCVTIETAAWLLDTPWRELRDALRNLPRATRCDEAPH